MTGYKIIENYRDDKNLRESFFVFTKKVFKSYDFKIWYDKGFWLDEFIPHSIIKDGEIISNVCISKMKIYVNGEIKNGLQYSTVGTLPEYRKQGLSNELMNYVLDKYKTWADVHFLFGNNNVLNFYPLFGFKLYNEVVFRNLTELPKENYSARKLNLTNADDYQLIKDKIEKRKPITKLFGAEDYGFITHWHLWNIFPKDIYYLNEEDLIIIATVENNELHLWDIIFGKDFNLSSAVSKIIKEKVTAVNYYFTPDIIKFNYDEIGQIDNSPLFIRENLELKEKYFKFPVTAQT